MRNYRKEILLVSINQLTYSRFEAGSQHRGDSAGILDGNMTVFNSIKTDDVVGHTDNIIAIQHLDLAFQFNLNAPLVGNLHFNPAVRADFGA
ncbi:hypothetical protein SDC9_73393 [bioreactor metagenome]|uniref:Uncharacterized protein n=1 Tax=bioreactor metagenome TaxID=1076179 RepID=A0A644YFY4_9ZZZZ